MRLALFGATGRTGRRLLALALDEGHTVRALARDPSRLDPAQGLESVAGDVRDPVAVEAVVRDADAVLVTLGGDGLAAPGDARSVGAGVIAGAMRSAGVRRVVALAGGGILDLPGVGLRSERPGYPAAFRHVTAEHRAVWEVLRATELDWTLVCTPDIPDAPATGRWRAAADVMPDGGGPIATGDVALFMLRELERCEYVRRRVGLAG